MNDDPPEVGRSDVVSFIRDHRGSGVDLRGEPTEWSVDAVSKGVNEVFVVADGGGNRVVAKFGTFSDPDHLRAGVIAYRVLAAYTDVPVPDVYATRLEEPVPAVAMEFLPGDTLAEGFGDTANLTGPDAVRLLGELLAELAAVPDGGTAGYGAIRSSAGDPGRPRAVGEADDWRTWFLDYAETLYSDRPDHERLLSAIPRALEHLRARAGDLPAGPKGSVLVTDVSPENLLAPGGTPPNSLDGVTGAFDFERAKLGPVQFAAVNAEHLLTRDADDPESVRQALYDPLPFGPEVPNRDLYRLVAFGREVGALAFWYDPGSERFQSRGDALADEIERIVE